MWSDIVWFAASTAPAPVIDNVNLGPSLQSDKGCILALKDVPLYVKKTDSNANIQSLISPKRINTVVYV